MVRLAGNGFRNDAPTLARRAARDFSNVAIAEEKRLVYSPGAPFGPPYASPKQKGTYTHARWPGTAIQLRTRLRNSAGESPTSRRNRLLKLPRDVKPTSKQI